MKPIHSCGPDNISNYLLKRLSNSISKPLKCLVNKSISEGTFPSSLKTAKVVPIHKGNNKSDLTNYRPISLLNSISKIFERVVYIKLYCYLTKNNFFYISQYGFRKKHSSINAISELIGNILKGLDNKQYSLSIFLDISKAFDTLDNNILLKKLENSGIRGQTLKWFNSYLSNRKIYVDINGTKSKIMSLEYGVPQGSILGPLLFLIYVNDLSICLQQSKSLIFADDTSIHSRNKNLATLTVQIENNLEILSEWFKANRLSINYEKTKFIIFSHNKNTYIPTTLKFGTALIHGVKEIKFLGLFIDSEFKWYTHVTNLCNRVSKNIYLLRCLSNVLPKWTLKKLYITYIESILLYGLEIWGSSISKQLLKRLNILQKKALRLISKVTYNTNTDPLFKKLNILKLDDLINFSIAKFGFNFSMNCLPKPVSELFYPTFKRHEHFTRRKNHVTFTQHSTSVFGKSFVAKVPSIYHSIPQDLTKLRNIKEFCNKLKKHYISKY